MAFGLGNFLYDVAVKDGSANFNFYDPEDANNTAEVTVAQKDFPEGINQATSRQVADLAFAQCSKIMNDKRDTRLQKEAAEGLKSDMDEKARQREEAADFTNNSEENVGANRATRQNESEDSDQSSKGDDKKGKKK